MSAVSPRPQLLLDTFSRPVGDGGIVGMPGIFGRRRLVSVLPLRDGHRRLRLAEVVVDQALMYLGASDGTVVGEPGVVVSRVVDAQTVIDEAGFG